MEKAKQYAAMVVNGDIVAGEYIKASCKRFLDDLGRTDLVFDEKKVRKIVGLIQSLKHYTGKHNGKPFILEPWQYFIVANIFGWYRLTGNRRFTSSYIEVTRKNGKTALGAAMGLAALIADGEGGAEIVFAANSKEQAKIAFDMSRAFSQGIDPKRKYLRDYRADIFFDATKSKLRVIAADDSKLDGFNASFAIVDEYHAAKDSKVRDVIKSSMGMRQNPHLMTITTAGFSKFSPCYELRSNAIEVAQGVKEDDSFFSMVYSLDEGDDWQDEANWLKCSPNLDVTLRREFLRDQVQQAKNNPSEELGVIVKNFNVWLDVAETWINPSYINSATEAISIDDIRDEDFIYIGVDLASVSDLTAVTVMFDRGGIFHFINKYFIPESQLNESRIKEQLRKWKRTGELTVTSGNVCDYDAITLYCKDIRERGMLRGVFYDNWNSTQWAIQMNAEGFPMLPYSQSIGAFNKPTKELERLILSGKVTIANNEITRFCFKNVSIKQDQNGNIKPVKYLTQNKIDGVISMIMSLAGYLSLPQFNQNMT